MAKLIPVLKDAIDKMDLAEMTNRYRTKPCLWIFQGESGKYYLERMVQLRTKNGRRTSNLHPGDGEPGAHQVL